MSKTVTNFQVTLTFQIADIKPEQLQNYISEKLLSGQIQISTESNIQVIDISGQIKTV